MTKPSQATAAADPTPAYTEFELPHPVLNKLSKKMRVLAMAADIHRIISPTFQEANLLAALHAVANAYLRQYPESTWWHSNQPACRRLLNIDTIGTDIALLIQSLGPSSHLAQTLLIIIEYYLHETSVDERYPDFSKPLGKPASFNQKLIYLFDLWPITSSFPRYTEGEESERHKLTHVDVFYSTAAKNIIKRAGLYNHLISSNTELLLALQHIAITTLAMSKSEQRLHQRDGLFAHSCNSTALCLKITQLSYAAQNVTTALSAVHELLLHAPEDSAFTQACLFLIASRLGVCRT